MIRLTRLNKSELILNADLIEQIQVTPDTVITTTNGSKFVVRESPDEIVRRVVVYRRQTGLVRLAVVRPEDEFETVERA